MQYIVCFWELFRLIPFNDHNARIISARLYARRGQIQPYFVRWLGNADRMITEYFSELKRNFQTGNELSDLLLSEYFSDLKY